MLRKRLFRMSGRAFRRAVMCSSVRRKRLFRIFPGKLRGCRCCHMRFSFMFFRLPVSVSRISFVKIKSNRNCINMHSVGQYSTCDTSLSVPRGGVAWRMSDKEFLQHTGRLQFRKVGNVQPVVFQYKLHTAVALVPRECEQVHGLIPHSHERGYS